MTQPIKPQDLKAAWGDLDTSRDVQAAIDTVNKILLKNPPNEYGTVVATLPKTLTARQRSSVLGQYQRAGYTVSLGGGDYQDPNEYWLTFKFVVGEGT